MSKRQRVVKSYDSLDAFRLAVEDEDEFSRGLVDNDRSWKDARDEDVQARVAVKKRPELPLTDNHKRYQQAVRLHEITFCSGPAGTGKTSLASFIAAEMFRAGAIDRVVMTRPLVGTGNGLGFLKGTLEEKMGPYIAPLTDCLREAFGDQEFDKLFAAKKIQMCPLETMRGSTFHRAFVILDEAQNATFEQLKMFVTRAGHGGKLVITGDLEQSDLDRDIPPLLDVCKRLNTEPRHPGFAFIRLTEDDVLRPDIVRFAAKRLARSWVDEGNIESPPSYHGISSHANEAIVNR